jgi:hypothetical protein
MWDTLSKNSALILSLAISLYTIYSYIEARIRSQRQRYALLRSLQAQSAYFVSLARALSERAEQVVKLYAEPVRGEAFPTPAAEKDSLPEEAEEVTRWLVSRAEHLLSYEISADIEKLGGILSKEQIDTLLSFIEAHRSYTQILATRTFDLKMFPTKKGVLRRFEGVVTINIEEVNKRLNDFRQSLGIAETEK